jgi:hypothetical protein
MINCGEEPGLPEDRHKSGPIKKVVLKKRKMGQDGAFYPEM